MLPHMPQIGVIIRHPDHHARHLPQPVEKQAHSAGTSCAGISRAVGAAAFRAARQVRSVKNSTASTTNRNIATSPASTRSLKMIASISAIDLAGASTSPLAAAAPNLAACAWNPTFSSAANSISQPADRQEQEREGNEWVSKG